MSKFNLIDNMIEMKMNDANVSIIMASMVKVCEEDKHHAFSMLDGLRVGTLAYDLYDLVNYKRGISPDAEELYIKHAVISSHIPDLFWERVFNEYDSTITSLYRSKTINRTESLRGVLGCSDDNSSIELGDDFSFMLSSDIRRI
jgi:hypothetical protein